MSFILNSSTPRKNNYSLTATSTLDWRAWWRAEAKRIGSDWPSLIGQHLTIADSLRRSS
jgi:hypothetical protein